MISTYHQLLVRLYQLLALADGNLSESERTMGEQMAHLESLDVEWFHSQVKSLAAVPANVLLTESVAGLKELPRPKQVNALAWMCVIANADGFMDSREWALIYSLYHKQLGLELGMVQQAERHLKRKVMALKAMVPR